MKNGIISTIIVTYNSEKYIRECLDSVKWADEVVVIDLNSTDCTRSILESFGCRVFLHDWVEIGEMVHNEAINHCNYSWILILDPDERVPESLACKLQTIANEDLVTAVSIPWKNYIFGHWMRFSGWNGDRHVRFFRKGAVSVSSEVHSIPKIQGKLMELPAEPENFMIHINYENISQFVEKLNRYTSLEVARMQIGENDKIDKKFVSSVITTYFSELRRRFFFKEGYRDELQGLIASELMAFYQLVVQAKVLEKKKWLLNEEVSSDDLLSEARKGMLIGMWMLFQGMEKTTNSKKSFILYRLARIGISLLIRARIF